MTTSIPQKTALVIGSAGGIGRALLKALNDDPVWTAVVGLTRRRGDFDLTIEATISKAARTLTATNPSFDLIIDATGILETDGAGPEKSFAALTPDAMAKAFQVNAAGPALLFKHFAPLLTKNRKSVFATLSARVGSIGDNRLGGWISYRASKAALNQIVRCAAIEIARQRPEAVIVALHPGTIETPLTQAYARGRYTASADAAAGQMLSMLESLGPAESGRFFDYAGDEIPW